METVAILIVLPVIASAILLMFPYPRLHWLIVSAVAVIGGWNALSMYSSAVDLRFYLSYSAIALIIVADVALLLYFFYQGIRFNSRSVLGLAALQLVLYGWAESVVPMDGSPEIIVDALARFMFLIINVVGGIIIVYALKYMQYEEVNGFRKRLFLVYLLLFLSVMNAIVIVDSLLLFFFLFEMTTLASYLLIGFRKDKISRENALKALWMNQIGGVAILLGTLGAINEFGTVMFSDLLHSSGSFLLLSVALISMAALVKGASVPFDGWLLGAMIAPTPVSAMLHSATMVKIAPFLILKLSPVLSGTGVGELLSITGALGFVAASYLALSRTLFKEILGYSTIALLGLMMSLAAIGTSESTKIVMVLIGFHALSKALLFLSAGVLEKVHHVKNIDEMEGLVHRAPKSVGFILFGFVSLTLPPFGLFMGKLFAIVSVASLLKEEPWMIVVLIGIVIGSALLVFLYFKVASALLSAPSDVVASHGETMESGFYVPLVLLSGLIVVSAAGLLESGGYRNLLGLAVPLLVVFAIPFGIRWLARFDRVKPYHCGEKEGFGSALLYFEPSLEVKKAIYWGFGILFVAVALGGALS